MEPAVLQDPNPAIDVAVERANQQLRVSEALIHLLIEPANFPSQSFIEGDMSLGDDLDLVLELLGDDLIVTLQLFRLGIGMGTHVDSLLPRLCRNAIDFRVQFIETLPYLDGGRG